ncbi:MAG TPA: hypothetical protein VF097_05145 [Actinomycetota bacterium]
MAVDERARHQLYNRVVEVLGEEEAVILMAHLPPGGYPNFATKQDLLDLERRMTAELKSHTFRVVFAANLTTVGVLTAVVAALA